MYESPVAIITRALVIISERYTNLGYKVKQDDGGLPKVCIQGALDEAYMSLYGIVKMRGNNPATDYVQNVALDAFNMSMVSVNDELGYKQTIKLLALTIERITQDAAHLSTHLRGLGLRRIRREAEADQNETPRLSDRVPES